MTLPDASERAECATVARSIVATLRATSWDVLAWRALPLASPRLAGVSVTLTAAHGRYDDLGKVRGSSSISIAVPVHGAVARLVTQAQLDGLERVVRGALVHECTHVIQRAAVPETFSAAVALEAHLHAMTAPTSDDAFDLYIGQPLEQQARAAQAAAEVEALIGPGATRTAFEPRLPDTEVWKRTAARIGSPTGATGRFASWWSTWTAMSYDAYR